MSTVYYLERQRHRKFVAEHRKLQFDEWKWVRIFGYWLALYIPAMCVARKMGWL